MYRAVIGLVFPDEARDIVSEHGPGRGGILQITPCRIKFGVRREINAVLCILAVERLSPLGTGYLFGIIVALRLPRIREWAGINT